jgi:hypothetical protein
MNNYQNAQGKQPLKQAGNGFQTVTNPGILTREKIEMQRAYLIEQLSKYPQAYNAYLAMS